MKKLCSENVYTFLGNENWHKIGTGQLRYIDMDNMGTEREITFYNFDVACTYLSDNRMYCASIWHTIFKKPCINYRGTGTFDYPTKTITRKKFKPFGEKNVWEENKGRYSFATLSKELSADEFIEYCKDHGMAVCPIDQNKV